MTRTLTTDKYIAIVRVTHESQTSPRKLLIEFVKHDIRQQRRQRTALRGPFFGRHPHSIRQHNIRFQQLADQLQKTTIHDPLAKTA
jgi:hypothetical protein